MSTRTTLIRIPIAGGDTILGAYRAAERYCHGPVRIHLDGTEEANAAVEALADAGFEVAS